MTECNTITYTLEPADMRAFYTHNRRHHPRVRRERYFALLVAGFISLGNALSGSHRDRWLGYFAINFAIIGGCALFFGNLILRMRQWQKLKSKERPGLFCEHTITLADEALIEVTSVNETRHPWPELHSVIEGKRHIFLFVRSNAAHTIPKRAFPDPGAPTLFSNGHCSSSITQNPPPDGKKPHMTLTFDYSREDWERYARGLLATGQQFRASRFRGRFFSPVAMVFCVWIWGSSRSRHLMDGGGAVTFVLVAAVFLAAWITLFPRWYDHRMIRDAARRMTGKGKPDPFGRRVVELTPEGVRSTADSGAMFLTAESITNVEATPELLVLTGAGTQAIIIPRVKVAAGEFDAAVAYAREQYGKPGI